MTRPPSPATQALNSIDWTVVGFMVVLAGTTFPVLSFALQYLPPLWVAFFRMAFAFPVIIVAAWILPHPPKPVGRREIGRAIALGIPGLGLYCALAIVGLTAVPPGLATVLACTIPLFIVLYAMAIGDRVPTSKVVAILTGFAGVVIVSVGGGQVGGGRLLGILLVMGAAALFALGAFVQRHWFRPEQYVRLDAWQFVGALVVLGAVAGAFEPLSPSQLAVPGPWIPLAWCVVSTGVAYAMWFWLLTRGGTSSVASTMLLSPIVAIILSLIWFHEAVTAIELVGVGVILAALFEVNRLDHPHVHPHPRPTP